MKVGIDIRSIFGERSGVGQYTYHLVKALAKVDRENGYLLYSKCAYDLDFLGNDAFRVRIPKPRLWKLWTQVSVPIDTRRLGIDVFHGTNFMVPRFATVPTVATVHDLTAQLFPSTHTIYNRFVQRIVPFTLGRCKCIITGSQNTKRDIISHFQIDEGKITVIPYGVSDAFEKRQDRAYLGEIRKKLGLPSRYILYVGTLEPRKNLPFLINAFARLKKEEHLDHRLVLAGARGWRYRQIFRTIEERNLVKDVLTLGYVRQEDLPGLYTMADLFVYPSLYEGFGLPPLEAMACGVPVITSNSSSLPEVVGNAAMTFDPRDSRGLVEKMRTLMGDEELRRSYIEQGSIRARQFTWERTARETLKVYAIAAEGKQS
jgi:glycosyltransferase involved in cell wall biosynthesis